MATDNKTQEKSIRLLLCLAVAILSFIVITACSDNINDNTNDYDLVEYFGNNIDENFEYELIENSIDVTESGIDESESEQLSDIHFYYAIAWRTTAGFSLDNLRAMYNELNEKFDYLNIIVAQHLDYIGYFDGDEMFIDTWDTGVNLRNQPFHNADGTISVSTPIRTIMVGRTLYEYFDNHIVKGRNFIESDFYLNHPEDIVNIILGFDYIEIHDIGDIITLSLHGKSINFQVIGFYNSGTYFAHMRFFAENIYFDASIVMPLFTITYEPIDDNDYQFQMILYSQKASGNIRIAEHPEDIVINNYEIHARYSDIIQNMAANHGLTFFVAFDPIPGHPRTSEVMELMAIFYENHPW